MMADMAESDDSGKRVLKELLTEIAGESAARFDNKGDRSYDLISALHKRGSAPDAALYWYARIITAGGDPLYGCPPLPAIASEDAATPTRGRCRSLFRRGIALPASGRRRRTGDCPPSYLACAPKSNAVYTAFKAALADARDRPDYDVPVHLRNAPTKLMKEMGYGQSIVTLMTNLTPMPPASSISRRKWRKRAIITRQTGGLRVNYEKLARSLNRIKNS